MADPNYPYTDFDVQSSDIQRRRTLASLLQKQGLEGVAPPAKGVMHWTQTLGPAMAAALGGFQQNQLDAETQKAASQRQQQMQDWMSSIPQGTPGVSAAESNIPQPGQMGPPVQGEGAPLLPRQADPTKMLQWGAQGTQFGPQAAKIGDIAAAGAMKNITDPYERVGRDLYNRVTGEYSRSPESIQDQKDKMDLAQQALTDKHEIALRNAQTAQDKQAADERYKQDMMELKRMSAAAAGAAGPAVKPGGFDVVSGRRVVEDKHGVQHLIGPDGLPSKEPFKGDTMPTSAREKEIQKSQDAREHLASVNSMMAEVKNNPGAYGTAAAWGASSPSLAGAWMSEKLLTPEQRQARASLAMQGAEITHKLYGSAFSAGEQIRAEPFIVKPTDPPHVVLDKMANMQRAAQVALANRSAIGVQGAQARFPGTQTGGGAPAAAAPAAPGGKRTGTDFESQYGGG